MYINIDFLNTFYTEKKQVAKWYDTINVKIIQNHTMYYTWIMNVWVHICMCVVCIYMQGVKHSQYLWEEREGTGIEDISQRGS